MEKLKNYNFGRAVALKYISRKPRTVFEVKKKLMEKGIDDAVTKEIVAVLEDERLLSDREYVREWLETVAKSRGYGWLLVLKKLKDKGIDSDLVEEIYQEDYAFLEKEIASREAKKKLVTYKGELSVQEKRNKLGQFLNGRGFQDEVILEVFDSLVF